MIGPLRLLLALLALTLFVEAHRADGLRAEVVASKGARERRAITVDLSWSSSWRDERNHDAVWIVLRSREAGVHRLQAEGHRVLSNNRHVEVRVSDDGIGAWIIPSSAGHGPLEVRLDLVLRDDTRNTLVAWALEMVLIPAGAFEVGDDAPAVLAKGALHLVGENGEPSGPFIVRSEAALELKREAGGLWYGTSEHTAYQGDQLGPIPADFPKGTRAFYMMKYELTQGQYARFLSALPASAQAERANHVREGEETETCTIAADGAKFVAASPERPCNFVSWADTCAFTDWMGLRPMTELEFEKACRGPKRPMRGDFPWGTASRDGVERTVLPSRDLALYVERIEDLLDDKRRIALGASYYRVMDLSGSMWERVISIGHPDGRAFRGTHGDGKLDATGNATNADWPRLDAGGHNAFGIGYRGGADYFGPKADVTNPFSCVGTRTFAGWEGGDRYKTYSARAVRSVSQ